MTDLQRIEQVLTTLHPGNHFTMEAFGSYNPNINNLLNKLSYKGKLVRKVCKAGTGKGGVPQLATWAKL